MTTQDFINIKDNKQLIHLLDSLPDYVVIVDVNKDILYLSKKFVEKQSVDSTESAIGRSFFEIFNTFQAEKEFQEALSAAHDQGIAQYIPRIKHKTQKGELKFYKMSISPFTDGGKREGFIFIFESMTDLVWEEEMNSLMVDSLVHYLNNVFNNIGFSSEAWEIDNDKKFVDNIRTEVYRLKKLVDNLSFLKNKGRYLPMKSLSLSSILEEILEEAKYKNASGVEVKIDIENDFRIYGNEEHIKRILEVVIDNAYDAMGKEGRLIIQPSRIESEIDIRIYNTGPPIDQQILEGLRKEVPFTSTKAKSGRGLGLGLYLAKKIAQYVYEGDVIPSNLDDVVEILIVFRGVALKS